MLNAYQDIRNRTEQLCAPLTVEDHVPQPVEFASPPKWHMAHTTWFFEEFVLARQATYKRFHPDFAYLFNSYYNNIGQRTLRADRGNMTRPTVTEVLAYRKYVDEHMAEILAQPLSPKVRSVVEVGLNHEQQHQELLTTDLKYLLGHNPLFPVYKKDGALVRSTNNSNGWLRVSEGLYEIGHDGSGFCYDNELGRHKVYLHDFEIAECLTTNGEFMEFMADGGYENFNLWLDDGWAWVQQERVKAPLYWHLIDGEWHHYTLGGLKPIQPNEVLCHVSFYEATAYAEWKNMRLPTETEWEIASDKLHWGERWEWTNSAYLPYPGFRKAEGALGEYNGKFMVNQMVLRGASAATSPHHSRKTYRNFFHPHFQWQFSGIRLARS